MGLAAALASASAAAPAFKTAWCQAPVDTAWRETLSRHIVGLSRTTAMVPLALGRDGRSFFAEVHSRRFSGVARIDATTSALTRIRTFSHPQFTQAWGAFDGRWLVWNEYRGYTSFDHFTVWAWDTRTRRLSRLGAATRGPHGDFWESPWHGADVRDGIASWVQGVGPDQLGEVHAYNLRTNRDLVVRHGHPGGAFLLDHHVVIWAEAPAPGVPTRMRAASDLTGKPVPVPLALRTLRNVTGLRTDGRRIGYPNAPYTSLWWSPSLREQPYEVARTRDANHVDNSVQLGGHYLGFGIEPRVFLANTDLGRYVKVSATGGFVYVDPTAVLVVYGGGKKVLHPIVRMAFVRQRDLPPMPPCR